MAEAENIAIVRRLYDGEWESGRSCPGSSVTRCDQSWLHDGWPGEGTRRSGALVWSWSSLCPCTRHGAGAWRE